MRLLTGLMVIILLSGCATGRWAVNNVPVAQPAEETDEGLTTLETIGLVVGLILVWGGVFYLLSGR